MDNKRWGKRFSTIFWWTFTILPLVVCLIQFIGYHLTFNSGISDATDLANYHNNPIGSFYTILNDYMEPGNFRFSLVTVVPIRDAFVQVFARIGVTSPLYAYLLGYMASVQIYHLLFDFFAWLPRLFHSWMERWCVE